VEFNSAFKGLKISSKELGWMGRDKWWAVVNTVMNLQVP